MVATRDWSGGGEEGNWELLLNVYRVSVLQDEKVQEIRCTIMEIYLKLLTFTLENV